MRYIKFSHHLLFLFLIISPFFVKSQTASLQSCSVESWIARWTISSISDLGTPGNIISKVADGSTSTYYSTSTTAPWTFDIDFGIVRKFTGLKIYIPSGTYAPGAYEIFVKSSSTSSYVSVLTGVIPYQSSATDYAIKFGGSYDASNVRIVFSSAYASNKTLTSTSLRLYEMNFFQCGVDPLIAKTIPTAAVPTPALSCAEGISSDIKGVINTYYPGLSDVAKGSTSITVDATNTLGTTHTLVTGDRVLIIQMQNTLICETNSMAYGDGIDNDLIASGWLNVQNTGEYEFGVVESVSGNTIQLTQPVQKSYSASGVFQVVYSPAYDNVTLSAKITAADWNGFCGGIVTFDAKTLNLNGQTIDVSAQGFRKGQHNSNSQDIRYWEGIYATDNNLLYGEKGEGIAGTPRGSYSTTAKRLYTAANATATSGGSYGRGAPATAGGGGCDHNSGGGGGANIGSGGQGGASQGGQATGDMTVYWNSSDADGSATSHDGYFPNGGMGGTGSGTPDPFRIWMGGAGGGGHQNDNAATGGANGGGIILATARVVKGTGSFLANGATGGNTLNITRADGAGGGGAGGTIVFGFDNQTTATITYSASGGAGGSIESPLTHGPGGGGGGGAIIVSALSSKMSVTGGANGTYLVNGSPWGANVGQVGKIITSDKLSSLYTYPCDHGDAPSSYLDAGHQIKTPTSFLGLIAGDAEATALNKSPHDTDAKGDDLNGTADEDGVEQPFNQISTAQSKYNVYVAVSNPQDTTVYLSGWIDFNRNGKFDDNEKVTYTGKLTGRQTMTWNSFPADIYGGLSYARFRISSGQEALQPTGVAPDGEVEDYTIYINGVPQAVPDTVCTHSGLAGVFHIVSNDNIKGDKLGTVSIMTPPANGTAVVNNNNTPDDKTDDYITYTPNAGFVGVDSLYYEICNSVGDCAKAKVTITVKPAITADFTLQPATGCTPLTVSFVNNSSDKTAQFTWDFGDKTTGTSVDPASHIYTTTDTTTVYTVKLTMNTGCGIITTTKLVTVNPLPVAVMTVTSDDDKPESVVFTDASKTSVSRTWSIDGVVQGTDKTLNHVFDKAGNYTVKLSVLNTYDCSDDTVVVHQTVFRNLFVPNTFMPNSQDTLVNKFKPIGYGLKEYSFSVYDLWGNLIWSTTAIDNKKPRDGWDGTKNGKPLPNDTYIWRIRAVFENNKVWKGMQTYDNKKLTGTYHTQGTVTILR